MATGIPHWYEESFIWDTLHLGGFDWPGECTVKVKVSEQIDRKKAKGSNGERLTLQGRKNADISIALRFDLELDWQNIQKLLATLPIRRRGQKDLEPVTIVHPKLMLWDITDIVVEDIEGPDETSERGRYELKFKCIEFDVKAQAASDSAKKATSTPKTSVDDGPTLASVTAPLIDSIKDRFTDISMGVSEALGRRPSDDPNFIGPPPPP